jgi:DNA modification methylase
MVGDVRERLRELPAASVQCVVTSPPYWGLRDYGTARWEGGAANCGHVAPALGGTGKETISGGTANQHTTRAVQYRDTCGKCGAHRIDAQLGLERTPEEYVTNMVAVFREVRRVLRDDGTLWLNLGDSYASSGQEGITFVPGQSTLACASDGTKTVRQVKGRAPTAPGLKPKDLVGIPWAVAFALRADGWWLRSDIVWSKPNPMPESVTDRPTKAHEYVFLLTKSERYFYDADAIREEAESDHPSGNGFVRDARLSFVNADGSARGNPEQWTDVGGKRNRRSVWTIATQPYSGAHFATFPEALVEPCILAGTGERGACATRPCVVLDPFFGSGTVGVVALKRGREAWGIELNPKYAQLARERIEGDAPLLNREIA